MRRLSLLIAAVVALLAPGGAAAAPLGELPFRPVTGVATCLRATGAPGELMRQTESSVVLLRADASGLTPGAVLPAPDLVACARAASAANGAGVIAFAARDGETSDQVIRAFLREPGQNWGASAQVAVVSDATGVELATAASAGGDSLVAIGVLNASRRASLFVARRTPAGALGAPVTLRAARSSGFAAPTVRAALTAAGEAVVAWAMQPEDTAKPRELWVASAPAGAPFGAPLRVGALAPATPFDVAVAPDGRALLAFQSDNRLLVAEREPGGAWGTPAPVASARSGDVLVPAVALRPDGAAVVAWSDVMDLSAGVRTRERPGPFAAPLVLSKPIAEIEALMPLRALTVPLLASFGGEVGFSGAGPDAMAGNPRAAYAADGRLLVTWVGMENREGVSWPAAHAAFVGATAERHALGAELRNAASLTPLLLAGGAPAVGWTDNDPRSRYGRIHLALEGAAAAPDPAAPTVRVGSPARRVLGRQPKLVLPVTCSAACDVRAQVAGSVDATDMVSLPAAGKGRLELQSTVAPIAPLRAGPVRVLVRYGAPGATRAVSRTMTLTLRRLREPPVPRVRGLAARREGNAVVVRWRTTPPADGDGFLVFGMARGGDLVAFEEPDGEGSTSFELRLTDREKTIRDVKVVSGGMYASSFRTATARVRG